MAIINGDGNPNTLTGGDENDTLNGLGGNDTLDGWAGVDTLNGGEGEDLLRLRGGDTGNGGNGADILSVYENGIARADGGAGTDTLRFETSADISATTLVSVERLAVYGNATMTAAQLDAFQLVSGYSDAYTTGRVLLSQGGTATVDLAATLTSYFELYGSAAADVITFNPAHASKIYVYAGEGADRIIAAAGADDLRGEGGNDVLSGLAGDDILDGGTGVDTLNGGEGADLLRLRVGDSGFGGDQNDILAVHESLPAVLNGGGGTDTLRFETSADITGATLTSVERLAAYGNVQMTAAQLAQFAAVAGYADNYTTAQVSLTQGGAATVNLSATLASGYFRLYGSAQADVITFAPAFAGRIYANAGEGADEITGASGADVILGEGGDDRLFGGAGADDLDGGAGLDALSGGDGADLLRVRAGDRASGGNDDDILAVHESLPASLNGGAGTDTLRSETSIDISATTLTSVEQLFAYGNVTLTAAQLDGFALVAGYSPSYTTATVTLSQGGAADVALSPTLTTYFSLTGSAQADLITVDPSYAGVVYASLGAGADRFTSGAGADQLNGGDGADVLNGLAGNDRISGDAEGDTLSGGDGDDLVAGGLGADIVRGGAGNDQLAGYYYSTFDGSDSAVDQVFGEDGDDIIGVSTGDRGDGGAGDDVITASGAATLIGREGDDRLVSSSGADRIEGSEGSDTVSYEYSSTVTVDLSITVAQNTGNGGTDTITGVENLTGSSGADVLRGTTGDNVITGLNGADYIDGRAGRDTASYAGAGAVSVDLRVVGQQDTLGAGLDTLVAIENLIGSGAADRLIGDAGANVLEGGLGDDALNGLAGTDTASYAGATAAVRVSLALTGAQNTLGAGVDTLTSLENLRGSAFGDTLTGNAGANRLEGGAGSDTLDGGAGADVMVGGDGSDTYVADSAADVTTEAADAFGTDAVRTALAWTLAENVENLTLTGGAAVNGTGNAGINRLTGNDAANTLAGLAGNDTLNGAGGVDRLVGGAGADTLNGGADADFFVFTAVSDSAPAAPDVIQGFDGIGAGAGDRIDLSALDANPGLAGDQAFAFGSQGLGGVWLTQTGTDTYVRVNLDADADAEFVVRIVDGAAAIGQYAAADFVL